jgi:hypothetical protein
VPALSPDIRGLAAKARQRPRGLDCEALRVYQLEYGSSAETYCLGLNARELIAVLRARCRGRPLTGAPALVSGHLVDALRVRFAARRKGFMPT